MKKSCTSNPRKKIAPRSRAVRVGGVLPHVRNGINLVPGPDARPGTAEPGTATAKSTVLEELRTALQQVTAGNHPRTFKLL
jgi:hypothetical protein